MDIHCCCGDQLRILRRFRRVANNVSINAFYYVTAFLRCRCQRYVIRLCRTHRWHRFWLPFKCSHMRANAFAPKVAAKVSIFFEIYKFICKILQRILFLTQNPGKIVVIRHGFEAFIIAKLHFAQQKIPLILAYMQKL